MVQFKGGPMLAVAADDLSALRYPLLASYKMDGIRAVITSDGPRTRSLKEIPNAHVRAKLSILPAGLDGELAVVKDGAVDFRATTSAVMNRKGEPDFRYFVFDFIPTETDSILSFDARQRILHGQDLPDWVIVVEQWQVHNADGVRTLFAEALAAGHEGLILRSPNAAYKFGRSTLNERGMLKVKPWEDAEARIIDILPEFHNTNTATVSETGRTKRSHAAGGLVQKESMGKLVLESPRWPKTFEVGTGFTAADRAEMWAKRDELIGELCKFSFITVGGYDVPRSCSFRGIRHADDLS